MTAPDILERIERETVDRYSRRLKDLGAVPRALGWDTGENQAIRFEAFTRAQDLDGRHVLDVGCGFGDFYGHLKRRGIRVASYTGWDVNPDLLTIARARYPEATFEVRNVMREPATERIADVVVAMGVLNFRLSDLSNEEYAIRFLEATWPAARQALLVDMLSAHRIASYPAEPHVHYYDPGVMMARASRLTMDLAVIHDYPPIPQKEFILKLRRPSSEGTA